jgi:hypothetical protein
MKEQLARFHMKNGEKIDMSREDGNIVINSKEHTVVVPQATGQQTLDWIALYDGMADNTSYPEESED